MPTDYILPTAIDLRAVEQDLLPNLMEARKIFGIMPIDERDSHLVEWEQEDAYYGFQQARGLNGAPPKIQRVGMKKYAMQPGVYGEFAEIDEVELTTKRVPGSFSQFLDLRGDVAKLQMQLLQRRLDRIETIGWTLLTQGTFAVSGPTGSIIHTDSYTTQTFTSSVPWATYATATPLADLRTAQLLARGHSVRFDATSKLYINRATANRMFSNTNNADLYGRRTQGLGTFNSPDQINTLLVGDDLPQIEVYDNGPLNDAGTFQPFIPDGKGVLVGSRTDGAPVMEYLFTRNANRDDMSPGAYYKVIDRGIDNVPRSVEVHDGHNGGPAMYFPSAVIQFNV